MYPNNSQNYFSKKLFVKQQGISLAFLLFAIIVISLLAAAIMRLNSQSLTSTSHHIIATRAFFAAESGANLQAMYLFPLSGGVGNCSNRNFNFIVAGLNGCSSETTCLLTNVNNNNYYQIISKGECNSGQILQATRTIEVRLKELSPP